MRAPVVLNSEMNVTPFLDVLLVLLVFFMAILGARRTVDTQLPEPSVEACVSSCETIVLEVKPGRRFALNKASFSRAELQGRLRSAFAGRPTSTLYVKGDPKASYQDVVGAMDAARGAGVRVLAIAPKNVR